jgi:hypothetical protein
MERVKGIEACADNSQVADNQQATQEGERGYTQIRAQIEGNDGRDLAQVVNAWAALPVAFKAAILAIVSSSNQPRGAA